MGSVLARPVCHAIGMLYPAYRTFKVLKDVEEPLENMPMPLIGPASENENGVDQQLQLRQNRILERRKQQEQWLTYWLVMALFSVTEWWADRILSWFPFYYETKIVLIVWLQAPQTNGARWLYKTYLEPLLLKHERSIDRSIQGAGVRAQQLSDRAYRYTMQQVQQNLRQQFSRYLEQQGNAAMGSQQQQWEAFLRQHLEAQIQNNNPASTIQPQMYPNLLEMQQQYQHQQQ